MRFTLLLISAAVLPGCASLENRLVYFPQPNPQPLSPYPSIEDVFLHTAEKIKIHARWYPTPGSELVVLYCHGNGGNLEHCAKLARDLQRNLSASVLLFDYPGYGHSEGKPSETGCYQAAHAAYEWLVKEKGISPGRLVICGESLGGGVATELAGEKEHAALILIRTFASLPSLGKALYPFAPCHSVMVNRFDSVTRMRGIGTPVFIAQADKDEIMPFGHAESLKAAHGASRKVRGECEVLVLSGLGHNDPLPEAFFERLRDFLKQNVKP